MTTSRPSKGTRRQSRIRGGLPWAIFLVIFVGYPFVFDSPYGHTVGVLAIMFALMATGWNVLGGFAGQVSLGHAVFYGIGAYAAAKGAEFGVNPWLSILIGVVIAAASAIAIGLPVFRLRGHYFAIATIAVVEIVQLLARLWDWIGGARGISIPIKPDSFAEFQFAGRLKWEYYYIALALLVVALAATRLILRSRVGFYLTAIREDQEAAATLGVPVTFYKQIAFAFSAVLVAVAGGFYAQQNLYVNPPATLSLLLSVKITIAAVLGGVRSMWGPVIGGATFIALTEGTRVYFGGRGDALNLIIYGLVVMVIASFEPNGLIGLAGRARRLAARWRS